MTRRSIESRNEILSRLTKTALQHWGVQNKDIDSFDPVVKLLLSGFAQEIHRVYHEIENANIRVLRQLSSILNPGYHAGVNPAHALLQLSPTEPKVEVNKYSQFKVLKAKERRLEQEIKMEEVEVFFSPLNFYTLHDVYLGRKVVGNYIYEYDKEGQQIERSKVTLNTALEENEVLLGLCVTNRLDKINQLSLQIDWKNIMSRKQLQELLGDCEFILGNEIIKSSVGIARSRNMKEESFQIPAFQRAQQVTQKLEVEIADLYKKQYLSLDLQNINLQEVQNHYSEIEESQHVGSNYRVVWIKVKFNPNIDKSINAHLVVRTNCIPVVNRRYEQLNVDISNTAKIIPLTTINSEFLDLISVTDEEKKKFVVGNSVSKSQDQEDRTYVLRESGIERFDSRDSKELLLHLIDLLRDESAVFSAIGIDFLSAILKDLNQSINLLEQKSLDQLDELQNHTHYLTIKAPDNCRTIFVDFWSCAGQFGNNLGPNDRVVTETMLDVNDSLTQFISMTAGGRDKKIGDDELSGLKRSMISGGKVVTKIDIVLFVQDEFGEYIDHVEVKNGGMVSEKMNEGYISTVDVHIDPIEVEEDSNFKLEELMVEIKSKLEMHSPPYYNYRVLQASN